MTSPIIARRAFLGGLIAARAVLRLGLWMPVKAAVAVAKPRGTVSFLAHSISIHDAMSGVTLRIGDYFTIEGWEAPSKIMALVTPTCFVTDTFWSGEGTVTRLA